MAGLKNDLSIPRGSIGQTPRVHHSATRNIGGQWIAAAVTRQFLRCAALLHPLIFNPWQVSRTPARTATKTNTAFPWMKDEAGRSTGVRFNQIFAGEVARLRRLARFKQINLGKR